MQAVGTIETAIPEAALNHLRAKHQEFQQAVTLVLMGMGVNGQTSYDLDRGVVTIVREPEAAQPDPDA